MKIRQTSWNATHIAAVGLIARATSKAKRKAALLLFSVALLLAGGAATVRGQSALDGFDPNPDNAISVVVVQPDGKILLGGLFTTLSPNGGAAVTRNHIARLNPDGTLDTAFNPNADSEVEAIAVQADGKILVGGYFSNIGGQTRNGIARLDPTTGLADSFDPNATLLGGADVRSIVVQADGKILAGGAFDTIGGQTRNNIARLDATTGLADSFDPNANLWVEAIAVQADGKILAGGAFFGANCIGGQTRNGIARLDATTGLADSFDPSADSVVYAIAVRAGGKILAGGSFHTIGGQPRNNIAQLDATTGLADSFDPNANFRVTAIALQPDGAILAIGDFTSIGGQLRNHIARLDATTGLADSFDPNATTGFDNSEVCSIVVQADGKILVGGQFSIVGGQARHNIARLETDGRLDQTLNLNIVGGFVLATAVQPDGKILIGGSFTTVLGVARNNIARLNPDGTLDPAFNPNANDIVRAIAVQVDGKILAGGVFNGANSIGGQTRNYIARLDATTGLADSFDPNANDSIRSIVVQTDGTILAGGAFTSIGGQTRNRIARLSATTGLADSFDPDANSTVVSIGVQADGKILAGGVFSGANSIGGQTRNRIARLDAATGAVDLNFDPNSNGIVSSVAVQADGKILVGGDFTALSPNGGAAVTRNRIARLNPDGTLDTAFDPNANEVVQSIALQADGKILAGGLFNGANSIGGQTRNYIARLDATTGLADSFDPNANDIVYSVAVQTDGKILAGGPFTTIGGQQRSIFARLSSDTAALQNLAVTQTTVTWTRGGSSPQLGRVTFESSTNNLSYTPLGNGTAAGSNWTLTGLNLSTRQNIYIRARGYYRSGYQNGSASITESVRNAFLVPGTLGNISTRLRVETGDNVLIGGFIVTGTQPKRVIIRAIGPSLSSFFLGALADPALELRDSSGGLIASNDNWRSDQEAEIIATGIPPPDDLESAIVQTVPANGARYTAIVRGVNNTTGIAVVEAYDLDRTVDSKLANISTRGFVQTGDDVLIGGLIVLGQDPLRVIVRAIGPSLPVPGALANPTLELHDGNGALLASNDNWRSDQEAEIIATTIPPSNDLESAIVRDLTPGNYTAIVRGKDDSTGVALVEAYQLGGISTPPPSPSPTPNPSPTASPSPTPNPSPTPSPSPTSSPSPTPSPSGTPSPTPTPAEKFSTLATRGMVGTGNAVMVNAFIITGPNPKRVIVRGLGPSLPFPTPLQDPLLELRDSAGGLLASNNNWRDTQEAEIIATTFAPTNELESAIVATLSANGSAYTATVRGVNNTTGIGVNDLHDLKSALSRLSAVGTRGNVLVGNDVLISGALWEGGDVLLRALGPSLPLPAALGDPTLELRDGNGALLAANDDWRSDQEAEIIATGIPPSNDLEPAIVRNLAPGSYTAIVSGVNNATGIGYVQFYSLPNSGSVLPLTP